MSCFSRSPPGREACCGSPSHLPSRTEPRYVIRRIVPETISIARATQRNIHENVAVPLLTVGVLVAGTLVGEVGMAAGMLIYEMSALGVIATRCV